MQGSIFFNRASSFALRQNVVNMEPTGVLPAFSPLKKAGASSGLKAVRLISASGWRRFSLLTIGLRMYDFQSVPAHYTKTGLVILHFRFPARPKCTLVLRVSIAAAATNAIVARRRSGRVIPACRRSGAVPIPAPLPYIAANIIEGKVRMTLLL